MTPPGLLIGAPRSGSGKTTLTLGLLRAFRRGGHAVGCAKCGPDYIDPAFHQAAGGRASINLDSWAMSPSLIRDLAFEVGDGQQRVLCEAAMGLFDGVPNVEGRTGSAADIAAALAWPVLLVIDVSGQAQSAAAIVHGCSLYDRRIRVAGVVLNRVASPRHARLVTDAIRATGVPVVGALPNAPHVTLPDRHLGLVQAAETEDLDEKLDAMADFVTAHCDLDAIWELAGGGPVAGGPVAGGNVAIVKPPGQRIAVARDAAFSFFYPHLAQGWRRAGSEIRFFSPLADEAPSSDCDACWLPGGYPELHGGRLAAAHRFLAGLRRFAETAPVHGECGGYMVLGRTMTDADGTVHPMAGLLGVSTSFARRSLHLGYRSARLLSDGCLGPAGTSLRGHEFHYATITTPGDDPPFALVADAHGSDPVPVGSRRGRVSGSFFHVMAVAD